MLDAPLRRLIDPPLDRLARPIADHAISANAMTLTGFAVGLLAVPCLAFQWYLAAMVLIVINRLADGLDGAVARRVGATDFGGYLDIVCDFIFYAVVPLGFALARPENALPAAFLILSFAGTGSSFLAYAVMAAKRGLTTAHQGRKSLYYLGGLTEGSETIALFVAMCLLPDAFAWLAYGFGILCWVTTVSRVLAARQSFAA
ncbi:MAG: CDP-alcohol phosphatidyltransferase family protein [Dongiaceae bacterium]